MFENMDLFVSVTINVVTTFITQGVTHRGLEPRTR